MTNFDYTHAETQRVREELELLARQKPKGMGRGRKLAGVDPAKRAKRDRRAFKGDTSAESPLFDGPAPRSLYNFDKIAAKPDASIVLCDSENAAIAAARVFPEWIATALSGGAYYAAAKTDWRPLAGRRVLV
jgi:hypothetical protein